MSVRRALVGCVVLSLQGNCVFYPCCKGCLSKIDTDHRDSRCRCAKCGYSCSRDLVEYRYRLSLRVARDRCIFGVTVFGTCLNPFFGISASDLQRLVENPDGPVGPSARSMLLLKSVEDCFIGRHFIFGIKLTDSENGPWLGGPATNGCSSNDRVQVIATQMILPKAQGLAGCTVVSYYQSLLQKAAEHELGSAELGKTSRPPPTSLLMILHHSPGSSFSNDWSTGFLSHSLLRSETQDSTFTPTPPWQQSLGLVTSSAEQEEGRSPPDSGDEDSRLVEKFNTPCPSRKDCLKDRGDREETELSPMVSLERSSYSRLMLDKGTHTFIEKGTGNSSIHCSGIRLSPPGHSSDAKWFPTKELNETLRSSSVVWEHLPFSESLTEFFCEDHKYSNIVSGTEPNKNIQTQKEIQINMENKSYDKKLSIQSSSVSQTKKQGAKIHSPVLLDITNTDGHEFSDQICRSHMRAVNKSQDKSICAYESHQENEKNRLMESDEEQLEGDVYNCSADLFSNSPVSDFIRNTPSTLGETVQVAAKTCPVFSMSDAIQLKSEMMNIPHSTPEKQKLSREKSINRDSFPPPDTHHVDFIPPSQSTPIVKAAASSGPPACLTGGFDSQHDSQKSCAFHQSLSDFDSNIPADVTSSLRILQPCRFRQHFQRARESTKGMVRGATSISQSTAFTPKRKSWKPEMSKRHLLAQQHLRIQRGAPDTGSTGRINLIHDKDHPNVTVCDFESSKIFIPPTPLAKTQQHVKHRTIRHTYNSNTMVGSSWEGQRGGGVHCQPLLDQAVTSSWHHPAQAGNSDPETVLGVSLDDENEACDWSRDLFSDSV